MAADPRSLVVRAPTLREALERIRRELGPDAQLQRMRRVRPHWWRRALVEVEAGLPAVIPAATSLPNAGPSWSPAPGRPAELLGWMGIAPAVIRDVLAAGGEELAAAAGAAQQLSVARRLLGSLLPEPPLSGPAGGSSPPVALLGPPGCGKSTLLGKWIARSPEGVLWRLDAGRANGADLLSAHAGLLGVPTLRSAMPAPAGWIDLPGVGVADEDGRAAVARTLAEFGPTRRWLVLSATHDLDHQVRSARFLAPLGCEGIVVTHLDEDGRASRLFNLAVLAGLPVVAVAYGPGFSGRVSPASSDALLSSLLAGSSALGDPR